MSGCRGWRTGTRGGSGVGGEVSLDCFIVSATSYGALRPKYGDGKWTREKLAERHIVSPDGKRVYPRPLLAEGQPPPIPEGGSAVDAQGHGGTRT